MILHVINSSTGQCYCGLDEADAPADDGTPTVVCRKAHLHIARGHKTPELVQELAIPRRHWRKE